MNIKLLVLGFCCSLLWFFAGVLPAFPATQNAPEQPVQVRLPDPEKLKAMQDDRDFQYGHDVRPGLTWWEQFKQRIRIYLSELFSAPAYQNFWSYLMYAFALGITIFIVLKLLQVDFTGLFSRQAARQPMAYETLEENIHEMDFPALIEEAIRQQDFRKAVRLSYLHVLKNLTDRELINWSPGKTNRSYVTELGNKNLRPAFEKITGTFEFVWYGGSTLSEPDFQQTRQAFSEFNHQLKRQG